MLDVGASGAPLDEARRAPPRIVSASEFVTIPPGEVLAKHELGDRGCAYVLAYAPDEVLQDGAAELQLRSPPASMSARENARMAKRLVSMLQRAESAITCNSATQATWDHLLGDLAPYYAGKEASFEQMRSDTMGMRHALAYLESHWARAVSLERLAREADLSTSYFCRQFARVHGLPPHRYQMALRVACAKEMLLRGVPIAVAASATGFADQSHFGRQLRSHLGMTPGELVGTPEKARTF